MPRTLVFLGVGEAFDGDQVNNAQLLVGPETVLVDCGFTVPHALWRYAPSPDLVDMIVLTHLHGDHAFGLPALLVRLKEEGRTKPLTILAQAPAATWVRATCERAYPGSTGSLPFPLVVEEVAAGDERAVGSLSFSFAPTVHAVPNLAVRVAWEGGSLYSSGDGALTDEAVALMGKSTIAVQECFTWDSPVPNHGTFDAIRAREPALTGVDTIYLVHISRYHRPLFLGRTELAGTRYRVPTSGDVIVLPS